jgi:hypothetical protein
MDREGKREGQQKAHQHTPDPTQEHRTICQKRRVVINTDKGSDLDYIYICMLLDAGGISSKEWQCQK